MSDGDSSSNGEQPEYNPGEGLQETYYDMRRRGSIIVWIGLLILLIFAIIAWLVTNGTSPEPTETDSGLRFLIRYI